MSLRDVTALDAFAYPAKKQRTDDAPAQQCLVLDESQNNALSAIAAGSNVFVTGPAGAGKSVVLRESHRQLCAARKAVAVTGSTGVSAVQVNGVTVYNFLGMRGNYHRTDPTDHGVAIRKGWRGDRVKDQVLRLDVLFIDEISMISAHLFDFIDKVMQAARNDTTPFGGVQVVVFGDFHQLQPVPGDHPSMGDPTWKANAWATFVEHALTVQHRQSTDAAYAALLDRLSVGVLTGADWELLKTRADATLGPCTTHLVGKRATAAEINQRELSKLNSEVLSFDATVKIAFSEPDKLTARIHENVKRDADRYVAQHQAPETLEIAVGATVQLLRNLDVARGLANGSMGKVVDLDAGAIVVEFECGVTESIKPHTWTESLSSGKTDWTIEFTQYPLALAYALTVHKAQGLTLPRARLQLSKAEMHSNNMLYVAFSRVRKLEDLSLTPFRRIPVKHGGLPPRD